jgi:hypothetical protein
LPEQASTEIDSDMQIAAETDTRLELTELTELTGSAEHSARRAQRYGNGTPGSGWLTAAELAEGGLLADVGVVLDLAAIYLPVVGVILSFAVPTPFAILMLRRGARVTLLSAAVAAFLITVLAGPHFGWRMGLEATLGFLLGWAMRARIRPSLAVAGGTLLLAIVTFVAGMAVIFVTGLPISDIVGELRNILESLAWLAATGASIFGLESQWLAIRPTLAAIGLFGLHVWPLLLFCVLAATTIPVVASYYALANSTAQVLGHDVPAFPSRRSLRLLQRARRLLGLPALLLRRVSGRQRSSRKSPVPDLASAVGKKE